MPIIEINMIEGRDAPTKRALIGAVTQAAVDALQVPIETVRVLLREYPRGHWGIAGVPKE